MVPMTVLAVTWEWPQTPILIAITLVVAIVATWLLRRSVRAVTERAMAAAQRHQDGRSTRTERILAEAAGIRNERYSQRAATLGSLLTSIVSVVMLTLTVLTVLAILEVPLTPLLASASVGGVALAFGAQSLVKDYLSGILMIFEDQYGVGDVIDTGTVTGTVEEVGLRVTKLRDATGQVWYVRNGEITRIGNLSQGWSTATVEVPVAPDSDPVAVLAVLNRTVDEMDADPAWKDRVLERPNVAGVDAVSGTAMTFKILAKTPPNKNAPVQRELLERCVRALAQAGVKRPTG